MNGKAWNTPNQSAFCTLRVNISGAEDVGPKQVCHQEDHRPGHAGRRPSDGQCLAAEVCVDSGRGSYLLHTHALPNLHLPCASGTDWRSHPGSGCPQYQYSRTAISRTTDQPLRTGTQPPHSSH
ncbi:uncharacterized protein LOC143035085 isoform X8 [Oratosquilla oratoria]|uniref:uncharacterized protein LOC143035085 isoform X8 n=1 Tax=Oratosquilla oratoria TaxID=337810 RepID=UPI003F75E3FB